MQTNRAPFSITLAAQKMRRWRKARRLTAAAFGDLFDPAVSEFTVYGWEMEGKRPRPAMVTALAARGVCEAGDWYAEPEAESDGDEVAAVA